MVITATDFQLSVNEYFTRLMKGEEIIIERYGKKFAVLVPYERYAASQQDQREVQAEGNRAVANGQDIVEGGGQQSEPVDIPDTLTQAELTQLIKKLLNN